ncbi:hypothetical protein HHK36_022656 [Tetracentron sinense]|uniref:Uncharacterized protein n=1 Tax=Tetracentron sinense TaxID=13715 RepID=A0A835D9U5_TETSI|nr:hypothetical protein HHK36_022656 [Tetracentron sinense]
MNLVNPMIEVFSWLWDCISRHTNYIRKLQENLSSLRDAMGGLKHRKNDVKAKLEQAEVQHMRPKEEVQFWIQSVEAMESQVDEIVEEGTRQISNRCLGACCPRNCCSSYKIGKRVSKKLTAVERLSSTGNFSDVVDILSPADVEFMPCRPIVGMDLIFENVWRCLTKDDQVGIMGLYGMGGVGKTTLLKKINNEFLRQGTSDSRMVIWIVVSKDSDVTRVQKEIAQRVGLLLPEDASQSTCASRIFNALSMKKFVLLLDDIWDRVDFDVVGIPFPNSENMFKIVGEEALNSHLEIPRLAKVVAKECAGLPLALITIGQTMASKKSPHEWNHAITVLRKSASNFSGMGDEVLPLLKFSYDSLPNATIQSCFLYCSLYPEDYDIDKEDLIEHWIGEGFIMEFNDMKEARYQGHDIIGTLKLACLLESGYNEDTQVKMLGIIRDLALWVASEYGRKKDKLFVQTCVGLNDIHQVEKWEDTERISLMNNDISTFTESPTCPNLVTLLLNGSDGLGMISNGFFKSMTGLRVLDLSNTLIEEFPMEIVKLVELQYLNLSNTNLFTLPGELKILVKLKYLDLRETFNTQFIPFIVISSLPRLQVLNLYHICVNDFEFDETDGPNFEDLKCWAGEKLGELECLKHLKVLRITITTVTDLQRLFNSQKLSRCTDQLRIQECEGLTSFPLSSISSSSSSPTPTLGNMKRLNELFFVDCSDLEELTFSWIVVGEGENDFSSSLETLNLENLPNLKMVRVSYDPCFQNLSKVYILWCDSLKNLTWILTARSLQSLDIQSCKGIEEVICGGVATMEEEFNIFSRLKTVWLNDLPKLKSIYRHALPFPSLEKISINKCPELKNLPFDCSSAKNTLKEITGEKQWWDKLEWEDESIEPSFLPYFKKNLESER